MIKQAYIWLKQRFVFPHLIFWTISIILFTVVLASTRDFDLSAIDFKTAMNFILTLLYLAVAVYINILWLIPRFFRARRFLVFIFLETLNILLFIFLNFISSSIIEGGHPNLINEFIAEVILVCLFLIISTLLTFTRDAMALQDVRIRMKEAERQKIEAELIALRSQVNPHFFFNTLNSLYSLCLDKSDKAPELILKLSDLMRYLIYEARDDMVPVGKQLQFIENYIYIEKIRSTGKMQPEFEIRGSHVETPVDPLLFIAFVENAFKHVTRDPSAKPFVRILFDLTREKRILFRAENNYEHRKGDTESHVGLGLVNARQRLDLLYPGRYRLEKEDRDGAYRIILEIETA